MKDEVIGNFRIVDKIGAGGMGEVYVAEQKDLGTRVAIKVLLEKISRDRDQVQRFFNEARAVSKIPHGGIVKISDAGFTAVGRAYLVMELLDGETLSSVIARGKQLSLPQISEIGTQIASILDATHKQGITHRDLKPDNIFLVVDAERASGERVKILDFGIAKLTGTLGAQSPNTVGAMGTPAYMAPEQWGDAGSVDWRADLYSLGCVIFEMASGRTPFTGLHFPDLFAKVMTREAPKVSELAPGMPKRLDDLVARLLSKKPEQRGGSMKEVQAELAALGEASAALDPRSDRPDIDPDTGYLRGMLSPGGAGRTWGVAPTMAPGQPTIAPVAPTMPNDQPTIAPGASHELAKQAVAPQQQAIAPQVQAITPQVQSIPTRAERDAELPRRRFPIAIIVGLLGAAGAGVAIFAATRGGGTPGPIDAALAIVPPIVPIAITVDAGGADADTGPSCRGLAERVAGYAKGQPKLRPAIEEAVRTVVERHCEAEGWSKPLRNCVAASNELRAAWGCLQPLGEQVMATYPVDLEAESARTEKDWVVVTTDSVTLIDQPSMDGAQITADSRPIVAALARVLVTKKLSIEMSGVDPLLSAARDLLVTLGVPAGAMTLVVKPVVGLSIRVLPSRLEQLRTGSAAKPAQSPPTPTPSKPVVLNSTSISFTEHAHFASGEAELDGAARAFAASVAGVMAGQPEMVIKVEGHMDNTEPRNVHLGVNRAKNMASAIAAAGVARSRIKIAGFGPEKPIASNDTEAGRASNRRVEIHVVN